MTAVAAEMPLRVLADLFGMPRDDRHLIFEWSNALLGADNPSAAEHAADSMTALAEMMAYGQAMADARRADPRDDVVSRIVNAEVDGERLTDTEFQMFWLLLVVAGNETTRNAVSGAVVALHEHDRWRWLGEHPEHLATAVEELLRYVSPVQHFRRTATRGHVLGDQHVRAGDKVVIWFGAANRDPDGVPRPAPPRPAARARTRTWRSVSAPTSASAPTSPGSRPPRCCGASSTAAPGPRGGRAGPRRLELHQRDRAPAGARRLSARRAPGGVDRARRSRPSTILVSDTSGCSVAGAASGGTESS